MRGQINHLLKRERKRQFWTTKEAAELAGVSNLTYIRWEQGTQLPHLSSLKLLCEAFRTTPECLGFSDLVNADGKDS